MNDVIFLHQLLYAQCPTVFLNVLNTLKRTTKQSTASFKKSNTSLKNVTFSSAVCFPTGPGRWATVTASCTVTWREHWARKKCGWSTRPSSRQLRESWVYKGDSESSSAQRQHEECNFSLNTQCCCLHFLKTLDKAGGRCFRDGSYLAINSHLCNICCLKQKSCAPTCTVDLDLSHFTGFLARIPHTEHMQRS